jgi:hypothetical protein
MISIPIAFRFILLATSTDVPEPINTQISEFLHICTLFRYTFNAEYGFLRKILFSAMQNMAFVGKIWFSAMKT